MMLFTGYKSKKELKENIGNRLKYRETSMFGPEYKSTGVFCGAHRPAITGLQGGTYQCTSCEEEGPPWWMCRHGKDVSERQCDRCEMES